MKREEAKIQYLQAKENYSKACLLCESNRITNRDQRRKAYDALRLAEIDLIDLTFDVVEARLHEHGKHNKLLNDIIENPFLRHEVAKISLLV
jgi:hypothetical protein